MEIFINADHGACTNAVNSPTWRRDSSLYLPSGPLGWWSRRLMRTATSPNGKAVSDDGATRGSEACRITVEFSLILGLTEYHIGDSNGLRAENCGSSV